MSERNTYPPTPGQNRELNDAFDSGHKLGETITDQPVIASDGIFPTRTMTKASENERDKILFPDKPSKHVEDTPLPGEVSKDREMFGEKGSNQK